MYPVPERAEHLDASGRTERPLIIAHRGASAHAPENTLAAFQMAIDAGAEGVEFDVQLAKDGVPVVIHDDGLRRTANRIDRVAELTSEQLGQIDVGSWFNVSSQKRARPEFSRETVPTLESVLKLLSGYDGRIYVELKCDLATFTRLVRAVADIIRSSPLMPQMIVKSFCLAAIPEIRYLLPDVQTAALFEPSMKTALRRAHIVSLAREVGASQLSLHRLLATPGLLALAARARMPVTLWTIDNPKWIAKAQKLGIAALITNDLAKMLAVRGWPAKIGP